MASFVNHPLFFLRLSLLVFAMILVMRAMNKSLAWICDGPRWQPGGKTHTWDPNNRCSGYSKRMDYEHVNMIPNCLILNSFALTKSGLRKFHYQTSFRNSRDHFAASNSSNIASRSDLSPFFHRRWTASGTEHLPDGFLSQRRRSLPNLAPSLQGAVGISAPLTPGGQRGGGAGDDAPGLAGDGAEIVGGGVWHDDFVGFDDFSWLNFWSSSCIFSLAYQQEQHMYNRSWPWWTYLWMPKFMQLTFVDHGWHLPQLCNHLGSIIFRLFTFNSLWWSRVWWFLINLLGAAIMFVCWSSFRLCRRSFFGSSRQFFSRSLGSSHRMSTLISISKRENDILKAYVIWSVTIGPSNSHDLDLRIHMIGSWICKWPLQLVTLGQ